MELGGNANFPSTSLLPSFGIRNRPADDFLPQCSRTKYIKANNRTNNSTRTITKHRILQFHSHTIRISPIFFQLFILLLFFITSLRAALQRLSTDEDEIIANTPLGVIRGINQRYDGRNIRAFLGVPYAKKPLGTRRFAIPEMIEAWKDEFKAFTPSKTCYSSFDTMFPQFPGSEMWNPTNELDEDCLSMNIWVPEHHDRTVMVWIYGGGFFSGSPSLDLYDGRVLAHQEKAIIVNINYRLGPFGFLYFGEGTSAPGNVGLMDQQLALKWINKNIASFGGDPKRITLFGESSGAASSTAHLFAPGSRELFSKIIAKSSVITNNWATKPKSFIRELSLQLARRVNCTASVEQQGNHESSNTRTNRNIRQSLAIEEIIKCLSRVSAAKIQLETDAISESLLVPMTFAFVPIEEDSNFFKGNVFEKLRNQDYKKDVSLIFGTVKDEGSYWLPYYLSKYGFHFNHTVSPEDELNQAHISETDYIRAFDTFQPYFANSPLVRHALLHAYSLVSADHNQKRPHRWRDGVARFLGDYFFTCSLIDFADTIADNVFGPVYMYYFTKRSSANPWPKWMGVMHGYEIEYVFGMPFRQPKQYDSSELELERGFSQKVMEFWGHFARTGEPIDYWPKYNKITRKSLVLNEEIARENSHRIYVDVHGKLCRLINEAQSVVRIERREGLIPTGGNKELFWDKMFESKLIHSGAISSHIPSVGVYIPFFFIFVRFYISQHF